ncbi:MAG: hypothetical protein M1827_001321 [Pycnora praestabilis]|nr:MAG: hypothetical protein M1827_001321 [Pycnora praestabilis]
MEDNNSTDSHNVRLRTTHPSRKENAEADRYAPPPGPPPSQIKQSFSPQKPPQDDSSYAPPAGPPPGYHDWTVIPDTALLPPPPSIGHGASPTNNANADDAERAHQWCRTNILWRPRNINQKQRSAMQNEDMRLMRPREFSGELLAQAKGSYKAKTKRKSRDALLMTELPLYSVNENSPLATEVRKTIYFEVRVISLGKGRDTEESGLALGFCAQPYPSWRLPGWERGSLGVHGDDGRRYVNDTWGGKDFTQPFKPGQTVGIGMTFSIPDSPPSYDTAPAVATQINVEVFFTRDGKKDGGWNIHEELDADPTQDGGVQGLDGLYDLYGAMGTFGSVEFEVFFDSKDWLWRPR